MTANDVGRNDPCPCGSGKKYKYCCLRKGQQRRRQRRRTVSPRSAGDGPIGLLKQVDRLTRRLRKVPGEEARELERQGEELMHLARFVSRQQEIEAALEALEARRPALDEFWEDPTRAMERALELFSEERFDPLRVSVEELEQAFELVGYPAPGPFGMEEEDMEILFEAATYLVGDEQEREHTAQALLGELPDLVAAERFEDAWLVQHSAYWLIEHPNQPSPFSFVMVQLGYEEMDLDLRRRYRDVAEELGIDVEKLRAADRDQVEALAQELKADPAKQARIERFVDGEPSLARHVKTQLMRESRRSLQLLERQDSDCLLLSPEQLEPWLVKLAKRGAALRGDQEMLDDGAALDGESAEAMIEAIYELTLEMSPAVFTEQRCEELVEDLQDYRDRLREAGEDEAARWADVAIDIVQWEVPPASNPFLLATCYASVRKAIPSLSETTAEPCE